MRLVRLRLERFGAVRDARVEFGPGLNVLYGPNDLGKSTLAQAIRAALLLPPGSSAHKDFVPWDTDDHPEVELEFRPQPDGRFYRVCKTFGEGAAGGATLHGSADGHTWTEEARGRKVDGEIRNLLNWGIPEPGGRGGTRGLPQSFLTATLLAEQADPAAIFKQSIDEDADESGKKLLTHALQALAQHPLMKLALDAAQARIDEAFTATGRKKSGRASPFRAAAEAIRLAEAEHEQRVEDLRRTREVEAELQKLNDDRLLAEQERDTATADVERLERELARRAALDELQRRLDEARAQRAEVEKVHRRVADGVADERRLQEQLDKAEQVVTEARKEVTEAEARLEDAKEALRQSESADAARERELSRRTLEKELVSLEAERARVETSARQARAAQEALRAIEATRERIAHLEQRVTEASAQVETLASDKQQSENLREQLSGLAVYEQWRSARVEAEQAGNAKDEARSLRGQLAKLRRQAEQAGARQDGPELPDADALARLRKLNQQYVEASARLGGGLAATVRVKRPLNITVSVDDGPEKLHRGVKQRRSFEAASKMTIDVANVTIDLQAGDPKARAKAEKLLARWEKQGQPVLDAAGVRTFAKLEEACREADDARREAGDLGTRIEALEQNLQRAESAAAEADALAARVKKRAKALERYDREALEVLAERLGDDREAEVERLRTEAGERAARAEARRAEAAGAQAEARAELKSARKELTEAEQRLRNAQEGLDGDWQAILDSAAERSEALERRRTEKAEQLEALEADRGDAASAARAAVERAEAHLEARSAALSEAAEAKEAAVSALAEARAELRVRREQADTRDLDGAQRAVEELTAELDAADRPDEEATAQALEEAREHLDLATRAAAQRAQQIAEQQGALKHVGGDVARDRERMAREAVTRTREREAELDLDYNAWRVLHETLREVESEESIHLGRALVQPISERFARLTGGRYGAVEVDPDLKTRGIRASGDTRDVDSLSAGLRDQLATIFRLSVAEHLKSLLVLDDQLAQTDPGRVDWFGRVLRETSAPAGGDDGAEPIQIILLTCRPREFLRDGELPADDNPVQDAGGGWLRAIDLERVVERYTPGTGSPTDTPSHG